jgi:phytepsin
MIHHSVIWNKLLASRMARETSVEVRNFSSFRPRVFSDLSGIHGHSTLTMLSHLDQSLFPSVDDILANFASDGPLLARLILTGALASPVVVISLQRDTVDIGGNQGMLSIGELPAGLAMEDLTWVPLRGYTAAEGGLPAPEESPNEVHLNARIIFTLMNVESDLPHYLGSLH